MSDTKHTPGPWHVSEGRSIEAAWETHEVLQICSLSHTHWSTDPAYDDVALNRARNRRINDEMPANARLIAAAPELLGIAKRWAALDAGAWHATRYEMEKKELMSDTEAAIAKAEGEKVPA